MDGLDEVIPVSQCLVRSHLSRKYANNALGGAHLQRPLSPPCLLASTLGIPTAPQGAVQPTFGTTVLVRVSSIVLSVVK
jgi:hypothetical protein